MKRDAPGGSGGRKVLVVNRRARHEYDIEDSIEAGIVLTGTEIKSVRAGKVQLQDAYARIQNGEAWVHNVHIAPYEQGNRSNVDAVRPRKLLLHRREIDRLLGKAQEKGLTLVPLSMYLRNGFAKMEVALGRGRKLYDKREAIANREAKRDQERALSERR
jgi:SsrA-binding protein